MILVWVTFACLSLQSPYEDKLPVLQEVSAYAMGMVLHCNKKWLDARPSGSKIRQCVHPRHERATRIPIPYARLGKNTRRRVPVAVARVYTRPSGSTLRSGGSGSHRSRVDCRTVTLRVGC